MKALLNRKTLFAALLMALFAIGGCEQDGPAEEAGENIDEAAQEAGEEMEEAADEIEDEVDG